MALFDFLFGGGTAAPDVTTSGISTTEIPEYIAKPSAQLIGAAADVASEEYIPYTGPRLAGLSPEEEAAIKQQRGMAGTGYNEASFGIGKLVGASDFLKSTTDPEIILSEDLSIIVFPNITSSPFDFESKPKLYLKPEHPPP